MRFCLANHCIPGQGVAPMLGRCCSFYSSAGEKPMGSVRSGADWSCPVCLVTVCFFKKSLSAAYRLTEMKLQACSKTTMVFSYLGLRQRQEKQRMVMDHRSGCLRCLPEINLSLSFISQSHPWHGDVRNPALPAVVSRVYWSASSAPAEECVRHLCIRLHLVGRMEGGARAPHMWEGCMNYTRSIMAHVCPWSLPHWWGQKC